MFGVLILVVVLWAYIPVKTHQIVHFKWFKWMWFIVYKLYITEVPGKEIRDLKALITVCPQAKLSKVL